MSDEPVNFPRFLLLNGPQHDCIALSDLLCSANYATYMDFADPLYNATSSIFFNNHIFDLHVEDDEFWTKPLPLTNITFAHWIDRQKDFIRDYCGNDILGRLFLQTYKTEMWEETFPNLIIRDFDNASDIRPLIEAYGPDSCICVFLGTLNSYDNLHKHVRSLVPQQTRNIWIPVPEARKQLAYLLHEMENLQLA